jgi:hypothetical protein
MYTNAGRQTDRNGMHRGCYTVKKLFDIPGRETLVSDIPAWDGNIEKLFYGVDRQTNR